MKANIKRMSAKFSQSKVDEPSAIAQTERDFKDAILTVSVFANLFILCLWVALQTTSAYDTALASFFITR